MIQARYQELHRQSCITKRYSEVQYTKAQREVWYAGQNASEYQQRGLQSRLVVNSCSTLIEDQNFHES